MSESGISPNSRDDLNYATSEYLNRPCRSLIQAVRDISATRDMPIWVWDDLLCPRPANVIRLQDRRDLLKPVGGWSPGSVA